VVPRLPPLYVGGPGCQVGGACGAERTKRRLGKQRGPKLAQIDLARRLAEAIWHMLVAVAVGGGWLAWLIASISAQRG
jgi:hypothetical protein